METAQEYTVNAPSTFILPDLDTLEDEKIPVSSTYWEPRKDGALKELRGVVIGSIKSVYDRIDPKTGEVTEIELECFEIAVQLKSKTGEIYYEVFRNGAVLLVADLKSAIESGRVVINRTPIKVEYIGLKSTKNGNSMDKFRITILGGRQL
ncbi:hypothetical protein [Crenothrix polyspora]|uniref:Uncharacterized protein n=1 Tax=Crenothrix polyspora TaxID=360316 RepID=A0A1R4HG39_9GAMM|nr:hypothetical protein [Crenothrix polyspora]SJM94971.1 hypothetical protein CRENPOLYSF1_610030 [Crenothrix polyspora]